MYASQSPTAAAAAGAGSSQAKGTVLTVKKTKIGDVLVNAKGDTIYYYKKDKQDSGKSDCTGACAQAWPAVVGKPVAGSGVTLAGKLGFITRSNGTLQATYNGYPLYTYASDMAAGDTTGNGAGGSWYVITGKVLTGSTSTSSGSSGGGSSGGGYGSGY
jgi:predicted lipoprotein with Yx(FWY)xxD motif